MVDAGEAFAPALEVVDVPDSGSSGAMNRIGEIYTVQVHLTTRNRRSRH